jgi:hypothetical protein
VSLSPGLTSTGSVKVSVRTGSGIPDRGTRGSARSFCLVLHGTNQMNFPRESPLDRGATT